MSCLMPHNIHRATFCRASVWAGLSPCRDHKPILYCLNGALRHKSMHLQREGKWTTPIKLARPCALPVVPGGEICRCLITSLSPARDGRPCSSLAWPELGVPCQVPASFAYFGKEGKLMGRRPSNTLLLRARVPEEIHARVELRLYSTYDGKRKYGAMSDLITSLLQRWLRESETRESNKQTVEKETTNV